MYIKSAVFTASSHKLSQIQNNGLPEFAFIGRSNVGKSSLINMLTGNKNLAKVSSTPGKTQLVNHFIINNQWYLVDLPGYGYARVSKNRRQKFLKIVTDYILKSDHLHFLFVLIDSRIEPQQIDKDFVMMLGENGIPFGIIFTKSDKVKQSELLHNVNAFRGFLSEYWQELPPMFISSSVKKTGKDEVLNFVDECLSDIK